MADERTTPTPKAGKTDTMHSTPDVPDRARGEGDQRGVAEGSTAPPSDGGSVGGERPHKTTIPTKDAGTLVEDIPDNRELETPDNTPLNPGQEAPELVARQPSESDEDYAKRTKDAKRSTSSKSKSEKK